MFWHRSIAIALCASAFTMSAAAPDSTADALARIPPCGLECIAEKLPLIGCGLLDFECQCNSKNSTAILQPCLLDKCTFDETFGMSMAASILTITNLCTEILRAQADLCNRPHDSYTRLMMSTAYVTGIIPVVAIAMRFASRWVGGNHFWWDDWIHLVSAMLCVPLMVCFILNVDAGVGKHLWDLTYQRVYDIGLWTYIITILWAVEMLLLKYSILCLYLRIFPNIWLKRAVFAFMAFTACFTLPLIFTAAIRCNPVRAQWDLEAAKTAKCLDWLIILKLSVVYEIIAEVVLFALPVPIVLKLQMATAKKIELLMFFGVGLLLIGVAIARVPFLKGVVDQSDQTYTIVASSMSTFIASGLGHVCAAVPTIQALIRFVINGFKNKTQAASSYGQSGRSYESSKKKSYRSLEDKKSAGSSYSGATFKVSKQRSKDGSKDPYRLSTQNFTRFECDGDEVGEERSMELQPAETFVTKHTSGQAGESQSHDSGEQPTTVVVSSSVLEDSASDKAILDREYVKST
ncbi:hypothetical protein COCVIDRAFT_106756 [Bipolaris victoriae FI3]|uniref:CFEM domain-containing protein n=1 Tax=Bipolaris victoriae (strain FI3) TaxID=930091 RepID=W7EB07_BIPV3|nr:hypothetical protein COCVIDRAFT_106756 [Bipolaris victoriae FI3]